MTTDSKNNFDVAEAVSKLTSGYLYEQLKQKDIENKYYKFVFYGKSVYDDQLTYAKDDLRTTAVYRSWANHNKADEFMALVVNGVETPIMSTDCHRELFKCLDEIIRIEDQNSDIIRQTVTALYKRFGQLYAALTYFGKDKIGQQYIKDNYDLAQFTNIKKKLNEFIKIAMGELERFYDKTEYDMKHNNVGIYLLKSTHRTKEFIDEYDKIRKDYYDSIKDILEILEQKENLSFCINSAKIGDMINTNNEDCKSNVSIEIEQTVTCIENGMETKNETEKTKVEDNNDTGYQPKDKDKNKGDDKPNTNETFIDKLKKFINNNKTAVITTSVVIVVVLMMLIFVFVYIRSTKKNNTNVYPDVYSNAYPNYNGFY